MVCKFGPVLGHVTQENEDILFKDAHSHEMKRVLDAEESPAMRCERVALEAPRNRLLGVTEAEVGDLVKFAVADVGGELRGVETAPQLYPRLDRSSMDG